MNKKQEAKYKAILSASMKVILEKGFEKASISEIVKEAGVAHGTFYLYFPTKSAIVPAIAESIFDEQLEEIRKRSAAHVTIWDTLWDLIDVTFYMTEKHKELLIFCYSGLAFYHSFERWEEIYLPYYKWLAEKLEAAKEKSEITLQANYENIVKMLINSIENTAENYYFSIQHKDEAEIKQLKEDVFTFMKRALQ